MHGDLELLLREIDASLAGLSAAGAQTAPKAEPLRWSIQQIMEHLCLTYVSTIQVLESRIEKGRPTLTRPQTSQRFGKLLLLSLGYFPRGRRAPAAVSPPLVAHPRTGQELFDEARLSLMQIDALTLRGEAVFGRGPAVSHFVLGPLTMAEWRRFHLVHGRHHLKQIARIRHAYDV